jgi:hypothetical protein
VKLRGGSTVGFRYFSKWLIKSETLAPIVVEILEEIATDSGNSS